VAMGAGGGTEEQLGEEGSERGLDLMIQDLTPILLQIQ
jgi:hypothetical protein